MLFRERLKAYTWIGLVCGVLAVLFWQKDDVVAVNGLIPAEHSLIWADGCRFLRNKLQSL